MSRSLQKILTSFCILLTILALSCGREEDKSFTPQDVATSWADLTLYITKNTPANSPTYASRCVGYIGLTMYESIVHGYPEYQTLAGQLNGLEQLPQPEQGLSYDWVLALNAAPECLRFSVRRRIRTNRT